MVVAGKTLALGDNTAHRLCRPAWTSEKKTGMFNAHNHRHDRHLRYRFFIKSEGLYRDRGRKMQTRQSKRGRTKK